MIKEHMLNTYRIYNVGNRVEIAFFVVCAAWKQVLRMSTMGTSVNDMQPDMVFIHRTLMYQMLP